MPLSGAPLSSIPLSADAGESPLPIDLAAQAVVEATATGDIAGKRLSGTVAFQVTAGGALQNTSPLTSDSLVRAIAAGNPSILITLASSSQIIGSATGAVLTRLGLGGEASGEASGEAALVTALAMSGTAAQRAAAVAALTIGSALEGQAAAVGTVTGSLSSSMDLDAAASSAASASGATGVSTALAGQARQTASAHATLTDLAPVTGGVTYAVNLATGAATTWNNSEFERLVGAHGRLYGLRNGTLYRIGGDIDPSNAVISASVRFAPSDFGDIGQKRLETVYCYSRELTGLIVTPIYDEIAGIPYVTTVLQRAGLRASRAIVGLGNAWHTLGLIVANREGGPLDLASLEPHITPLSRRRR